MAMLRLQQAPIEARRDRAESELAARGVLAVIGTNRCITLSDNALDERVRRRQADLRRLAARWDAMMRPLCETAHEPRLYLVRATG